MIKVLITSLVVFSASTSAHAFFLNCKSSHLTVAIDAKAVSATAVQKATINYQGREYKSLKGVVSGKKVVLQFKDIDTKKSIKVAFPRIAIGSGSGAIDVTINETKKLCHFSNGGNIGY